MSSSPFSSSVPRSHKPRVFADRDARRQQLLEQQKRARRDYTQQARALIERRQEEEEHRQSEDDSTQEEHGMEDVTDKGGTMLEEESKGERYRRRRLDYAAQFQFPQWMDSIPSDLSSQWLILPRPEGQRCLVISHHYRTFSRLRSGRILHSSFSSALPGGHHPSLFPHLSLSSSSSDSCILDCIFNEEAGIYFACDLLSWKSYLLYDSSAEFRLYWLHSKLVSPPSLPTKGRRPFFPILPLPCFPCSSSSLPLVYPSYRSLGCHQDGLLLLHKSALYEPSVLPTPLALVWKDDKCSRWGGGEEAGPRKGVVRLIQRAGWSEDGTMLGKVEGVEEDKGERLVKVRLEDGGEGGWKLLYDGEVSRGRLQADTLDKLTWQFNAAKGSNIKIEEIAQVIQQGELSSNSSLPPTAGPSDAEMQIK